MVYCSNISSPRSASGSPVRGDPCSPRRDVQVVLPKDDALTRSPTYLEYRKAVEQGNRLKTEFFLGELYLEAHSGDRDSLRDLRDACSSEGVGQKYNAAIIAADLRTKR